jgi:hypothetical protein
MNHLTERRPYFVIARRGQSRAYHLLVVYLVASLLTPGTAAAQQDPTGGRGRPTSREQEPPTMQKVDPPRLPEPDPSPVRAVEQSAIARRNGEILHGSLFFLSGPLPAEIPTLQRAAPYMPDAYKAIERPVLQYIAREKPDFFEKFSREMLSGDHVRVAKELRAAQKVQVEAILAVTEGSKDPFIEDLREMLHQIEREGIDPWGGLGGPPETDIVVDIIIIIYVIIAIVVLLPAQPGVPGSEVMKGLTFERYVDEVVRATPLIELQLPDLRNEMPSVTQ